MWHQALLEHIVSHYKDDPRVLAVCLFGSLARGNWDRFSDLDLDVVITDDDRIEVMAELQSLCAAFEPLGETALMIVPDHGDAGNVVLESLAELSIRYHPLESTSPSIVDDLMLLTGRVDLQTIQAAGAANRKPPFTASSTDIDRILRWAVEVTIAVRRKNGWQAVRLVQLMQDALFDIYADTRRELRAYHALDASAGDPLALRLGATLPQYSPESVRQCTSTMLDIFESDLDALSNHQLQLTDAQRKVIAKVRGILSKRAD